MRLITQVHAALLTTRRCAAVPGQTSTQQTRGQLKPALSYGPPRLACAQRACARAFQEPAYAPEGTGPAQARGRLFANFTVYKGKAAMALKVRTTAGRAWPRSGGCGTQMTGRRAAGHQAVLAGDA